MAIAIVAVEQDSYPPRVQVSVTGLTLTHAIAVYRSVAGVWTLLRGGASVSVTDTAFVVVDAELPFGVPVTYIAVVDGTTQYATSAATHALTGGKVALSDAITGASAEVVITGLGDKTFTKDSARFRVAGRNVVVSSQFGQAEGSYELLVQSTTARDDLLDLLVGATEGIVQIRQPGVSLLTGDNYDGIDAYLAVDGIVERRWSQDGSDPRRLVTISYAEVAGWSTVLEARGFTLGDIDTFVNSTLQALADYMGVGSTLLGIAQADWTA